jgi:hypothetical protein
VELLWDIAWRPTYPVDVVRGWREWNEGTLVEAAELIYERRQFEALPAVADAIEAVGFCDRIVLQHFRDGSQHARGCWLLDLLLGKS